jgi:hypothetical protein
LNEALPGAPVTFCPVEEGGKWMGKGILQVFLRFAEMGFLFLAGSNWD